MTQTAARLSILGEFYAALNAAEAGRIAACLTADAIYYMLDPSDVPLIGPSQIAAHWSAVVQSRGAQWSVDRHLVDGDEAVAEWTMTWRSRSGDRRAIHGVEWYVFHGDKIAEIRAYYRYGKEREAGLTGFPYAARGYTALD